jgi:uncharacterized protein DUF3301
VILGPAEIVALLLAALAAWLVWDTLRARERANAEMRAACEARGFLFLDDTVALRSLRPVRDGDGRVKLRRIYDFQYSDTGHNRLDGSITLVAGRVAALDLGDSAARVATWH